MGTPSSAIPPAQYYEATPEYHVGSWSKEPPGTIDVKPTQVHVRFGTPPGICMRIRFKSAEVVDKLIATLVKHRVFVWGPVLPNHWADIAATLKDDE